MSLDMFGHIDDTFQSSVATRTANAGDWVNGHWVAATGDESMHSVTVQPLSNKEIQTLNIGLERINDVRKIYINDGFGSELKPSDKWTFDNIPGEFKVIALDYRPWRNYGKIIVSLSDDT